MDQKNNNLTDEQKRKQEEERKKKARKRNTVILILMFLLLVTLFIVQCHLDQVKQEALAKQQETELEAQRRQALDSLNRAEKMRADSLHAQDSLAAVAAADSVKKADSLARVADSIRTADSIALAKKPNINRDSLKRARDSVKHVRDSIATIAKAKKDSIDNAKKAAADSAAAAEKAKAEAEKAKAEAEKAKAAEEEKKRQLDSLKNSDKTPPVAEIAPPAGRYYNPIKLKVKCDEIKCKTFLSVGDTLNPVEAGKAIEYNKTGAVYYYAVDSVGNRTAWEVAKYDMASDNVCGKNAYPVPVSGKTVCVDAYEYPNKADEKPKDMVSQEEAANLCKQEGKHLCSITEWQAACRGKDNTKYSYGDSYKQNKCNTNTTAAKRAGRKEQCRSWWGMNDMNGNLWEWTSTPDGNSFLVAGGAWNTNNTSKCSDSKRSFYPQNQYPSVGFRCCK